MTVVSVVEAKIEQETEKIEAMKQSKKKDEAKAELEAKKMIQEILPDIGADGRTLESLSGTEQRKIIVEKVKLRLEKSPQTEMFMDETLKRVELLSEKAVEDYRDNIIEIPKIVLQQETGDRAYFEDFDLDVAGLNIQPLSEEIMRTTLRTMENETIAGGRGAPQDNLDKILINEIINHPEVDYDSNTALLFKLTGEAIAKLKTYLDEAGVVNVVRYNKKSVADFIYSQMMEHFKFVPAPYEKPKVHAFTEIAVHNYSCEAGEMHAYTDTIEPANRIPAKIFTGFAKSCHASYKFDSKSEKDFATILEQDIEVRRWLRPAPGQFSIYWHNNMNKYIPDFIVETDRTIYMVEIKAENEMGSDEVQEKAKAGVFYCKQASDFTAANNGKQWKYVLIPHSKVQFSMNAKTLMEGNIIR
ncbi:MAG: hypothetical protein LLG37_11315 [Spirochaetia bacterium]|nr:hypothetical protein [Spirochaetia bacterium]